MKCIIYPESLGDILGEGKGQVDMFNNSIPTGELATQHILFLAHANSHEATLQCIIYHPQGNELVVQKKITSQRKKKFRV